MAGPAHKPALVLALGGKPDGEGAPEGGDSDFEEACKEFFDSAGLHTHDGNHIKPLSSDKERCRSACESLKALITMCASNLDQDDEGGEEGEY